MAWTERFEPGLPLDRQTLRHGNRRITFEEAHSPSRKSTCAEILAGRHLPHVKAQCLEPPEFVIREVWETAQSERLGHQPQILQHHALLESDKLRDQLFDEPNGSHTAPAQIIIEMPATASRQP